MCQVHTGAYVSLLAPGKTDYTRLPPGKDYHVYIARSTHHYAYARQTQVDRKKKTNIRKEGKEKERKEQKAKKRKKEGKKRKGKTRRVSMKSKREKNVILLIADRRN